MIVLEDLSNKLTNIPQEYSTDQFVVERFREKEQSAEESEEHSSSVSDSHEDLGKTG